MVPPLPEDRCHVEDSVENSHHMNPALVVASADCVRKDLAFAFSLRAVEQWDIFAVNDGGWVGYPEEDSLPLPLDHWCTFHADNLGEYRDKRRKQIERHRPVTEADMACETWSKKRPFGREELEKLTDHVVSDHWRGSSSLLAALVAIRLGYTRIVCAGAPLVPGPHFDGRPWGEKECWVMREDWLKRADMITDSGVRSCSGWTADLVGKPTRRWLDADD